MTCFKTLMTLALTTAMLSTASAQNKKAFLNAKEAGADFQIQGEYSGMVGDAKVGIQVIAQGDGKFNSIVTALLNQQCGSAIQLQGVST